MAELGFATVFNLHNTHVYKDGNAMPEVWKNNDLRQVNKMSISNYICVRQRMPPPYALLFYIKFVQLLRVLLFYICIRRPTF